MDRDKAVERLMALASRSKKRSKAAQLTDVIEAVETALAARVPRSEIIKDLAESGLDLSLVYFDTALKRIRKKRKAAASKSNHAAPMPSPAVQTKAAELGNSEEKTEYATHDPRMIDQILGSTVDLDDLAKYAPKRKKP